MRTKMQKSMLLVICITLLVTFLISSTFFYMKSLDEMKEEIKTETSYIQTAIRISGTEYLEQMDHAQENTRVTRIDKQGRVLYDSKDEEYELENHASREEVQDAFSTGTGEAIRTSKTIGKITYYYAVKLPDGTVLRTAKTVDHLIPTMLSVLPYLVAIGVVMMILTYFLAKWQTESIERQNRAKEEAANMRKEFSANVSHELKTPLTSISGYAEIMKSGLVKAEDMVTFSERIHHEASRMITLIGDIMKLSKLDEEQVELEREWVDLYALSEEICTRLAMTAQKRNVHVDLNGETVSYFGVRQILDEMIFNLCENAIKYNVDGGSVNVWVGDTTQGVKLVVEDTGIGIPEDQKERIFERFYRVDKSHSRETGGTGLGLSIVKHGAIYHHAEITVESELGKGTKMEVLFEKMNGR